MEKDKRAVVGRIGLGVLALVGGVTAMIACGGMTTLAEDDRTPVSYPPPPPNDTPCNDCNVPADSCWLNPDQPKCKPATPPPADTADAAPKGPKADPRAHRASVVSCSATDGGVSPGSNDECASDTDCDAASVTHRLCECGNSQKPNACVLSKCLLDSECGSGGFCSPSIRCGKTDGYFCHSKGRDECHNDDDCNTGEACRFHAGNANWKCAKACE